MTVRVLIADDQQLVRGGFRLILERQPGVEVVGEATNGAEAVALAERLAPEACEPQSRSAVRCFIEKRFAKC